MEKMKEIEFLRVENGSGDCDGSGYGFGSGYGIAVFDGHIVHMIDNTKTIFTQIHGNVAKGSILNDDLTLVPCFVAKNGSLFAHGETMRKAMEALNDKLYEDMPVEDRLKEFLEAFQVDTEYPVKQFFDWHHRLTGSCEMGRRAFAQRHNIDLQNDQMTVREFVALTRNDYGGEIIRELERMLNQCNNQRAT